MNCSIRARLIQSAWIILLAVPCAAWAQSQTIVTIAGTGAQG
ncbi:hypothetical protein HDG34_004485 [Paraburkholderia sp. HC6.4b]|nr:hypothetical protein [Paraburkholderia sp. HC6.4b]MBB5452668.1 hypothetical protein [Paraburkholderia sp. Kb1A]